MICSSWEGSPYSKSKRKLILDQWKQSHFLKWNVLIFITLFFQIQDVMQKQLLRCSVKKVFLKMRQISQENTSVSAPLFNQACNLINKRLQQEVFSYEICEIFKNTYFEGHLLTTASSRVKTKLYFHVVLEWLYSFASTLICFKSRWLWTFSPQKQLFLPLLLIKHYFFILDIYRDVYCGDVNQSSSLNSTWVS